MKKQLTMMMMAALLLGTGSTAAAADYNNSTNDRGPCKQGMMRNADPENRASVRDGWQKRMKQHRRNQDFMKEMLGLNDVQLKQLQGLRSKHFSAASQERRELSALHDEMRRESLKKNPDQRRISALSRQIGSAHADLALLRSRHMGEMTAILTPDQVEKMKTFMQERPGNRHGRMML